MNDKIKAASNGLSTAALIFGIFSVLGSFIVVTTPFFAPMAIMFAWLSRGNKKMSTQAAAGNILAVISIIISIIVAVILISVIINAADTFFPDIFQELMPYADSFHDFY